MNISESTGGLSRRQLLAVGGLVAIGGLSGCVSRIASSVTNTGASPAAVFAGERDENSTISLGEPQVLRLSPRLSAEARGLSGSIDLEGWTTSVPLVAANYNNTRSNRSVISGPVDFFDKVDTDDDLFEAISVLDAELQEATKAAVGAISKRSARTGRNQDTEDVTGALDEMENVLSELRTVLERCSSDSCVAARKNVEQRFEDVQRAKMHVEQREWGAFGNGGNNDILVGDYLLPPVDFDPSESYSLAEQRQLFQYLSEDAIVGERVVLTLPDAEVPGGNGSIRDVVTPQRLLDYLMGRFDSDAQEGGYSWGEVEVHSDDSGLSKADSKKSRAADGGGDCDDDDPGNHPGKLCGTTTHFVAEVSGPTMTGGELVAERDDGGDVVVTRNTLPSEDGVSVVVCPDEGEPFEPDGLDAWGKRADGPPLQLTHQGRLNGLTVMQVMVQPPGCPRMFPAIMYVSRGVSDGQLIYTGGWVVDDGALYANSATVLTLVDSARVLGIGWNGGDLDGDGFGDVALRSLSNERLRRGGRLDSGPVSSLVDSGVISSSTAEGVDMFVRKRPGRSAKQETEPVVTHVSLDAPVLHLIQADSASNEVKFKAGAELSGQVN